MRAEIIEGLDLQLYHDPANGFVSHSRLHDFVTGGAAYYQARYITGEIAREVTPSLCFGQALEELYQRGGDSFAKLVTVMPAHMKDGRSAAAKELKAAALKAGRIVISEAEYQAMLGMCASLRTCTTGAALTNGTKEQVTLRGMVHGLPFQARPDWVHLGSSFGAYSVDLKTTRDLNDFLREGSPAVWSFGYHTQAAVVRALLAASGYEDADAYLFVVQKDAPYRRACVRVPEDYLAWADETLREHCEALKRCYDTDTWPNGPEEIVDLQKPRWVRTAQQQQPEYVAEP